MTTTERAPTIAELCAERDRLYWAIHDAVGRRLASPSRATRSAEQAAMQAARAFDDRYLPALQRAWRLEQQP